MATKQELEAKVKDLEEMLVSSQRSISPDDGELRRLLNEALQSSKRLTSELEEKNASLENMARHIFSLEKEKKNIQLSAAEMQSSSDYAFVEGQKFKVIFRGVLKEVSEHFRKNNFTWDATTLILDRDGE